MDSFLSIINSTLSISLVRLVTIDCNGRIDVMIATSSEANKVIGNKINARNIRIMTIESSNIYNIAANQDFFDQLTQGIIKNILPFYKQKDVIILLPTQQSCSSLSKTLKELNIYIKNIYSINDLSGLVKLDHIQSILDRMSLVNKISHIILEMNIKEFDNLYAATELAEYFSDFLHKAANYNINLDHFLETAHEEYNLHQQQILHVLEDFIKIWKENNHLIKATYNNLLIDNISNKGLILAGINSLFPSIVNLTNQVANHPNGHVILYGLDQYLDQKDWNNLDITHSQYNFKQLLSTINIEAKEIKPWHEDSKDSLFISYALKPAQSCSNWHELNLSSNNIKLLVCPDHHEEAKNIIDIAHNHPAKSVMIISPDESLTIKIILHLKAKNIDVNIVRDYPLKKTQTAIWMQLCLNFILDNYSFLSTLALLKHPFAEITSEDLIQLEMTIRDKNFRSDNIFTALPENEFLTKLQTEVIQLKEYLNFKEMLTDHISFVTNITSHDLWENEEELKTFLDQLQEYSDFPNHLSFKEYSQLFNHFFNSAYYRENNSFDHKITLIKPIDARLHTADLVILAGLNENIWPKKTSVDPCFTSNFMNKIGLPLPETSIGEEAYDFQCFAQAKEVILTRSEKIDGATMMPSRWLSRFMTLDKNIEIITVPKTSLESKESIENINISPIPPLEYRPTRLSSTQIEKLIFNPYHIYVDLILKLKKLPPLTKQLSALDFGNFVHKAIELHYKKGLNLLEAGNLALKKLGLSSPQIELLWWPRFIRIAEWINENKTPLSKDHLESFGSLDINDNMTIVARADKMELYADNVIHIIDYKTGKLASAKSVDHGQSLQLLLEGLIAKNAGFSFQEKHKDYKIKSLIYIQLSGGEDPIETLEIEPNIEKTEEYIISLFKEYQDPSTPYFYTKKKILGYCEYAHLSRNI
jgi:ATP-dependent helicase/nuclease subunit B